LKNRYNHIFLICIIIVIIFLSLFPALNNGFTGWDDDIYITENAVVKDFSWENIQKMFTTFMLGYHPLVLVTYSIEYQFFKLNPRGYHITSLILHLLNCLLVFWIICILCEKNFIAFIVALLFGIHPLHVESVAWISDKKDLLASLFFLWALLCYLYYHKKESVKYYYLSLIFFVLSLLSKISVVTFPILLFVCDYFLYRNFDWPRIKEKIPFFVIAIIFGISAILARQAYQNILHEGIYTLSNRIFINIHRFIFYYLMRVIMPVKLSYLRPDFVYNLDLPFSIFISAAIVIISILITLVYRSKKYTKKIIFGSLFFAITIIPALMVIDLGYSADRLIYIPSIGIFYIIGEGFYLLYVKKFKQRKEIKILLLTILIFVIGILSFLTRKLSQVWKDDVTLWEYFVKNYPSDPFTYLNRGIAYEKKGQFEKAILDYDKVISIEPNLIDAYNKRGNSYLVLSKYEEAIADFSKAIQINPYSTEAYNNRGNAYIGIFNCDLAIADFSEVIKINPSFAEAYNNRGIAYCYKGDNDKALTDFNEALRINHDYASAYNNRGNVYSGLGKLDRALTDFNTAIRIDSTFADAYYNRAMLYFKRKEYNRALQDLIKFQMLGYEIPRGLLNFLKKSSMGSE